MKLIVSDVDGTLFPHHTVTNPNQLQDNIDAIKRWVDAGNHFAIASARGIREVERFKNLLGFPLHFIGSNGAGILLVDGTKIEQHINSNIYYYILDMVAENDWDASVVCSVDYKWLWKDLDHYPLNQAEVNNALAKSVNLAKEGEIPMNYPITKVSLFLHPSIRDVVKAEIESLGFNVSVTTCDVDMIDVIPKNASKANGILEVCKHLSIDIDDVYVVGDSENDVSMFKVTKNSYCIDHAEDAVKANASHIVSSVSEMIEGLL